MLNKLSGPLQPNDSSRRAPEGRHLRERQIVRDQTRRSTTDSEKRASKKRQSDAQQTGYLSANNVRGASTSASLATRNSRSTSAQDRADLSSHDNDTARTEPEWLKHRRAMQQKFPQGWQPPKRLSRDAMTLVRTLHKSQPQLYTTELLSKQFKVSAEAIRRILKSKFELSEDEKARREQRRKEERTRALSQANQPTWGGNVVGEKQEMMDLRMASPPSSSSTNQTSPRAQPSNRRSRTRKHGKADLV
ncbi:Required for respiratory growth protein 9 mitochondrial [Microbotryomycetes sp. JL201]|nr:Required for respiratory growth protein 9 mitochondrial [Microbotryomycetes sp. JL201]